MVTAALLPVTSDPLELCPAVMLVHQTPAPGSRTSACCSDVASHCWYHLPTWILAFREWYHWFTLSWVLQTPRCHPKDSPLNSDILLSTCSRKCVCGLFQVVCHVTPNGAPAHHVSPPGSYTEPNDSYRCYYGRQCSSTRDTAHSPPTIEPASRRHPASFS
jgi:hypothetical protein